MALLSGVLDYATALLGPILNKIVIAVFTFFIGLIVGRIAGKIASRLMHAFEVDKTIKGATGASFSVEGITELVISYGVYFLFLIVALNRLGLTQWVLIAVSGFAGIIGVVAAVLALKDVIPNAIAGFIVMRRQLPKMGDRVCIDNVEGRVVQVSILETRMRTLSGDVISFPNRLLLRVKVELRKKK